MSRWDIDAFDLVAKISQLFEERKLFHIVAVLRQQLEQFHIPCPNTLPYSILIKTVEARSPPSPICADSVIQTLDAVLRNSFFFLQSRLQSPGPSYEENYIVCRLAQCLCSRPTVSRKVDFDSAWFAIFCIRKVLNIPLEAKPSYPSFHKWDVEIPFSQDIEQVFTEVQDSLRIFFYGKNPAPLPHKYSLRFAFRCILFLFRVLADLELETFILHTYTRKPIVQCLQNFESYLASPPFKLALDVAMLEFLENANTPLVIPWRA